MGPRKEGIPESTNKRRCIVRKEFGARIVVPREREGVLWSPAANRYFPRETQGKRSWYCSYPDMGDGCSFCDGEHQREDCQHRNENRVRKGMNRNQVEYCEYPICRNPFSHKTIRCGTIARICRRCRLRGHTEKRHCPASARSGDEKGEREGKLRNTFETYRWLNKITSNDLFKFRMPDNQMIYKTTGPTLDEEVSCPKRQPLDKPEEIQRFRWKLERIQFHDKESIRKASAGFALRYETKARVAREFELGKVFEKQF